MNNFDNGEVLIGLNTTWTFLGAKPMEWMAGLVTFLLIGYFAEPMGPAVPFMILAWVLTTLFQKATSG